MVDGFYAGPTALSLGERPNTMDFRCLRLQTPVSYVLHVASPRINEIMYKTSYISSAVLQTL